MINFRYHVVTLVAVFLALGLGILFGASFIDQNTVKALETAQDRLSARSDRLVDRIKGLEDERDALQGYAESSSGSLMKDALKGRPVVILSFESTPKLAFESSANALVQAGAIIDGSYELSPNLDMSNQTRREQVAIAIGGQATDEGALGKMLVDELSATLAAKKPGTIRRLIDSGLASSKDVPGVELKDPSAVPSSGSIVVLIAGEDTDVAMLDRVALPTIESLSAQGVLVGVAGQNGVRKDSLIDKVRSKRGLKVVTSDGVDGAIGRTALALGLKAAADGRFGHYGSGDGADAPIPEISPRN